MPLTTGRLGETRRVGGARGALRTEIRRAERAGDKGLASKLRANLAQDNLNRAALGDSAIGSADSDIRQGRAIAALNRQQLAEAAKLASSPVDSLPTGTGAPIQTPPGSTPTDGPPETRIPPSLRDGTTVPLSADAPVSTPTSTETTAPQPVEAPNAGGQDPAAGVAGESFLQRDTAGGGATPAPPSLIEGRDASFAIEESRRRADKEATIARGELPFAADGDEHAANLRRFQEVHGAEKTNELIRRRAAGYQAREGARVAAKESEAAAEAVAGRVGNVLPRAPRGEALLGARTELETGGDLPALEPSDTVPFTGEGFDRYDAFEAARAQRQASQSLSRDAGRGLGRLAAGLGALTGQKARELAAIRELGAAGVGRGVDRTVRGAVAGASLLTTARRGVNTAVGAPQQEFVKGFKSASRIDRTLDQAFSRLDD